MHSNKIRIYVLDPLSELNVEPLGPDAFSSRGSLVLVPLAQLTLWPTVNPPDSNPGGPA